LHIQIAKCKAEHLKGKFQEGFGDGSAIMIIGCGIAAFIIKYIDKADGYRPDQFYHQSRDIIPVTRIGFNIPVFDIVGNEVNNYEKYRRNDEINKIEEFKHASRFRGLINMNFEKQRQFEIMLDSKVKKMRNSQTYFLTDFTVV